MSLSVPHVEARLKPLHVRWQAASGKGAGFCKVPTPSATLGVNACDISCKRCKPCGCFDYCPFCSDAPPVTAPGATCTQLACPPLVSPTSTGQIHRQHGGLRATCTQLACPRSSHPLAKSAWWVTCGKDLALQTKLPVARAKQRVCLF